MRETWIKVKRADFRYGEVRRNDLWFMHDGMSDARGRGRYAATILGENDNIKDGRTIMYRTEDRKV